MLFISEELRTRHLTAVLIIMTLNGYKIYKLLPQFWTGAIKQGINISKITFDYIELITITRKRGPPVPGEEIL